MAAGSNKNIFKALLDWMDGPVMLGFVPSSVAYAADASADVVQYNAGELTKGGQGVSWATYLSAAGVSVPVVPGVLGDPSLPRAFNCGLGEMQSRVQGWAAVASVLAHEMTHRMLWWKFGIVSGTGQYQGQDFRSYSLARDFRGDIIRGPLSATGGLSAAFGSLPVHPLAEYTETPGHWLCTWMGALVRGAAEAPIWQQGLSAAERRLWLDTSIAARLDRAHRDACTTTDSSLLAGGGYWPRTRGAC